MQLICLENELINLIMPFFKDISQDWKSNKGNTKGRIFAFLFRLCFMINRHKIARIVFVPYLIFYKLFIEWILSIEIPGTTIIGKGFQLYHGQATVVHKNAVIGSNCIMRHGTTIGNAAMNDGCPVIGNNVDIGCNVCIIGKIIIGNNVVIGAGSVVIKDVPDNCVIAGNPARIIRSLELTSAITGAIMPTENAAIINPPFA